MALAGGALTVGGTPAVGDADHVGPGEPAGRVGVGGGGVIEPGRGTAALATRAGVTDAATTPIRAVADAVGPARPTIVGMGLANAVGAVVGVRGAAAGGAEGEGGGAPGTVAVYITVVVGARTVGDAVGRITRGGEPDPGRMVWRRNWPTPESVVRAATPSRTVTTSSSEAMEAGVKRGRLLGCLELGAGAAGGGAVEGG